MRQFFIFLVAVFAFSGSLLATLATQNLRDFELRGYVDPTQTQDIPFAVPRLGVNVDLTQYTDSELNQQLALMQSSHFVWIRQTVKWDEIETQEGIFDWQKWDQIIETVAKYSDLKLVVVLMNSPKWARIHAPGIEPSESAPPQEVATFASFASQFAKRYADRVDYYQIWDEPNLDDAWGSLDPNPTDYVALLSSAYHAIHSADSAATIIAAALAPTSETSGQNISDIRYLSAMYQRGAKDVMDVVAGKPYGFDLSPLDRNIDESTLNFSRIIALREIMLQNGDGKKSLWASNWGWNALPDDWAGNPSIWGQINQEQQIDYTITALDRAHREWAWMGAMILQQWQPDALANDPQWGFALVNQENQATPLLTAIQNYPFPTVAQNGLFHPISPYAKYSGVWTFGELGADIGWLETTDSQLEFAFQASDISLLLREGDYVAFLYPTIDQQQANATPHDTNGNAYVFLRSNSKLPETNMIPIARNLPDQNHSLHILADKGWDQWALAGFAVSSGNLTQLYNTQISIGWIATLIAFMVVLTIGYQIHWRRYIPLFNQPIKLLSATSHLLISFITSIALMIAMLLTWSSIRPNILLKSEINLLLAFITGGLIFLSPSFILTLIAGIALFILIYHRLENGLILTLFWAPFFLFPVRLFTFAFPMVEILILITTLAWLLHGLAHLGRQFQSYNPQYPIFDYLQFRNSINAIDVGIIALVTCGFVSLLWTANLSHAITELRTMLIEPVFFYLILRTSKPDRSTIIRLVNTLIIAGTLVALIGLFLYARGEAIITAEEGARRLASVYGSPNNVGLFLGRCIPFALAYLLLKLDNSRRIFGGLSLLIMSVAVALSQSVGAIILGIPTAIVIVIITIFGKKSILPILGLGIIGTASFAILTQLSARFSNLLDFSSGTNFFRLRVWESALEIIHDFPITGLGLDQFLYEYSGHYIRPDAIWDRDLSHPHNFILDFWISLSIFGVCIFLWIQYSFWKTTIQLARQLREHDIQLFAIIVGLMGSMGDLLAHGLIDNSVFVIDLAFVFAFILALTSTLKNMRFIDDN